MPDYLISISPVLHIFLGWSTDICGFAQLLLGFRKESASAWGLLESLGPDIMCEKCTEEDIVDAIAGSAKPMGVLLLDQSILSGIGNVAKSESLFIAGIHPETKVNDLAESELTRLARSLLSVMWDSYKCGGRWTHRVYRRAGRRCYECGTRIVNLRQGKPSRSTYLCPRCQPKMSSLPLLPRLRANDDEH